jgi:hypothetical protein
MASLAYGVTITMLYQDAVNVEPANQPQFVLADADMRHPYDSPVVLPWVIGVTGGSTGSNTSGAVIAGMVAHRADDLSNCESHTDLPVRDQ